MKRMSRSLFVLAFGIGSFLCSDVRAQQRPPASTVLPAVPPPASRQPPPVNPFAPAPRPALENFLSFDAETKAESVTNGTPAAHFIFNLTNISSGDVTINFVQTSCGCTVAKLPSTPWKLASKESGEISATMQLAGTPPGGTKIKTLTVNTDHGTEALYVKATVLPEPAAMTEMDRTNNQKIAMADRQAVFKGDCASCHAATAKDFAGRDKMGQDLYAAVCGVCHEAAHQASFVPNLHHLPEPTNPTFWKNWIMHGKPGTLMPAFAKSEGGILSDAQIASLVEYLTVIISSRPAVPASPVNLQVK
jgi:mono/diheme cytochrome c family protein